MQSPSARMIVICVYTTALITMILCWLCYPFVTFDSEHYLGVANYLIGRQGQFTATWPVGYPAMIALVAKTTSLSSMAASKIVGALSISACFLILWQKLRGQALPFCMALCLPPFLYMFIYSWSEGPFVALLLVFAMFLAPYTTGSAPSKPVLITLSAIALFMTRYVGAFAIPLLFCIGVYHWCRRERKVAVQLAISSIVAAICLVSYMVLNRWLTGHVVGEPRPPRVETAGDFLRCITNAYLSMFSTTLSWSASKPHYWLLQFAILGIAGWRVVKSGIKPNGLGLAFLLTGVSLICITLILRWNFGFNLDWRMLSPGTLMLVLSAISMFDWSKRDGIIFVGCSSLILLTVAARYLHIFLK